ncbi:hypothetical protein CPC08DRAFT_767824 [Agrocybe pediades]|nr:hypothetical protein CPC08DRAFT_767824 [Agrocybe pediades]
MDQPNRQDPTPGTSQPVPGHLPEESPPTAMTPTYTPYRGAGEADKDIVGNTDPPVLQPTPTRPKIGNERSHTPPTPFVAASTPAKNDRTNAIEDEADEIDLDIDLRLEPIWILNNVDNVDRRKMIVDRAKAFVYEALAGVEDKSVYYSDEYANTVVRTVQKIAARYKVKQASKPDERAGTPMTEVLGTVD